MKHILIALIVFLSLSCKTSETPKTPDKVLVFTKTAGFRHKSIEPVAVLFVGRLVAAGTAAAFQKNPV